MKRILMIDDEQQILDSVETILEEMEFDVTTHSRADEGLEAALTGDFDLVLVDIRMPGMNGAEITEKILEKNPDTSVLLLTGFPSDPVASRALNAGALALVKKPFEIAKILQYLE